jgi:hypothetical protein
MQKRAKLAASRTIRNLLIRRITAKAPMAARNKTIAATDDTLSMGPNA